MTELARQIRCIFYSEFHHIAGPRILYQVPESFALREVFDAVHDLIITKPTLYNRLISVDVSGWRIVGCPKVIQDNKYERNALLFNVVFVLDSSLDHTPYEPVLLKLGDTFRTYELESSFLSNETSRARLPEILSTVMNSLNSCGFCSIPIDLTNHLHLKITPALGKPVAVSDHQVPIFTCSQEDIMSTHWDLTIEQILPYINGFNHVKRIAREAEVEIGIVKICVQHLELYGFLKLIGIFQYSNVYVTTAKVQTLLTDSRLQRECLEYVALSGSSPAVAGVFRLYCSLEAGLTVRDLCVRDDPKSLGVNERLLAQYGLMRGLIRLLQRFPVATSSGEALPQNVLHLERYLDGSHCFDQICCDLGVSSQHLEELLENCPGVCICWK